MSSDAETWLAIALARCKTANPKAASSTEVAAFADKLLLEYKARFDLSGASAKPSLIPVAAVDVKLFKPLKKS